jgi:hypothetical protein
VSKLGSRNPVSWSGIPITHTSFLLRVFLPYQWDFRMWVRVGVCVTLFKVEVEMKDTVIVYMEARESRLSPRARMCSPVMSVVAQC